MTEPEIRGLKGNVTHDGDIWENLYIVSDIVSSLIVIDQEVHKRTGGSCESPEDKHGDCLKGNTVIYNSNGESKTLKELVDNNIKEIDIIAFDTFHHKFVKAKAHSFRIGQYTNKIYKIHFSDDTFIECTSNHPFLKVNYIQISNFVDGSLENFLVLGLYSGFL